MKNKLLELRNVSKRFGGLVAVNDVSLETVGGGITGLIGPNGAGKTTTFNLITGTIVPDSGSIVYGGQDITGLPVSKVVAMGLVKTFQATILYHKFTIAQNIEAALLPRIRRSFVRRISGRNEGQIESSEIAVEVNRVLELTELDRYADAAADSLPYGLQKKAGVAVALATKPSLLLLDEPAAGLNHEEAREMGRFLVRLNEEHAIDICLVEHHMELVMNVCSKIVVLVKGEKLMEGNPAEVSQDPRVIEAYLGGSEIDAAQAG